MVHVLLLAVLGILFMSVNAFGCVCDTLPSVGRAFNEATAVFSGKYIGSEYRNGINSQVAEIEAELSGKKFEYEVLVHKFLVSRWYKGGFVSEAILVTDRVKLADGREMISDCDLGFDVGKSYLIYAYGDEKEYGTGSCTRTKSMKRARSDIAILKKLA